MVLALFRMHDSVGGTQIRSDIKIETCNKSIYDKICVIVRGCSRFSGAHVHN